MKREKNSRSSRQSARTVPTRCFTKASAKFEIILEVTKRHFRLDHPEFRQMPAGIGILGTKRGPEGVHFAERQRVDLCLKLAAHGQKGRAVKEIVLVDIRGCGGKQTFRSERRDAKDLPAPSQSLEVMIGV